MNTLTLEEFIKVSKTVREYIDRNGLSLRSIHDFKFDLKEDGINYTVIRIQEYQTISHAVAEVIYWKKQWRLISHKVRIKGEIVTYENSFIKKLIDERNGNRS